MSLSSILTALFDTFTWSEKPRWVSPPLQGTKFSRGKHLKHVWVLDDLSCPPAETVYLGLGGIDTSFVRDRSDFSRGLINFFQHPREVKAESCRRFLDACLKLPSYDDFLRSDCQGRLFKFDLAITDLSPGIFVLRWFHWLTLLGLGHAYLQIEGVLSEPDRDQIVMKFVARRRDSGLAAQEDWWIIPEDFGLPGEFRKSMIGTLIARTAYDVLMEIHARLGKSTNS